MQRENFKSRLGFILISAGCAIGIGNVWKFPYMVGQGGGGAFVLFYLIFLLILGLPVLTMEFSVGRASQKSPIKAFKMLEKPNQKWHIHGFVCLLGSYFLMFFYTTVAGWMLHYLYLNITDSFAGKNPTEIANVFSDMLIQPSIMAFWMVVITFLAILVCSFGVQKGLEKVSKVLMLALLGVMIILAINSTTLDGANEGLKFYLLPSFERMKQIGVFNTLINAMNQAFFTLSLGIGSMAIFGSYIKKDRSLLGESFTIASLDTFVAIVSGLIIFPACFTFNVDQSSGPGLLFVTLPNIFNNIPLGNFWGSLFFVFMAFASFSTVLAVFENIICCFMELFNISRKKSSWINFFIITICSLPCVFGFSSLSGGFLNAFGGTVLDLLDFVVSYLLLPLGSLVFLLFCTLKKGWGWKNFVLEANQGKGLKIKNYMKLYISYILPLIILLIFVFGLIEKFKILE